MKKRTIFLGAILSLMPLGLPFIIKTSVVLSGSVVMMSLPEKAKAENANFFYNRGIDKSAAGDYYGAISDFTKAIEINPRFDDAYYNRGSTKSKLDDHYGAISDFTKAIEIQPADDAYYNRGNAKGRIKDYYGAISDYTKAIEINPQYVNAYANRSIDKKIIGDIQGACVDAQQSVSLGNERNEYKNWIKENC